MPDRFELRLYSDYWDQDLRRRKPINGIAQNTEEVLSMYGRSRTGAYVLAAASQEGRAIDSIGLLMAVKELSFPEQSNNYPTLISRLNPGRCFFLQRKTDIEPSPR